MLIITNGDSALSVIEQAGIGGDVIPWRDVLHEGPVPDELRLQDLSRVRARFLSDTYGVEYGLILADLQSRDRQLNTYEEVLLWFEHDLYDQLQLLQLLDLDWFSRIRPNNTRLRLICRDSFIAET